MWRNLKRSKPPVNEWVELQFMVTGSGGHREDGWVSIGRIKPDGKFIIKQNSEKTVDFRHPTHWQEIKTKKLSE